jgi:hypothetical protein
MNFAIRSIFSSRMLLPFGLCPIYFGFGAIAGDSCIGLWSQARVAAILLFDTGGVCSEVLVAIILQNVYHSWGGAVLQSDHL